jgi:hypothetical protein
MSKRQNLKKARPPKALATPGRPAAGDAAAKPLTAPAAGPPGFRADPGRLERDSPFAYTFLAASRV